MHPAKFDASETFVLTSPVVQLIRRLDGPAVLGRIVKPPDHSPRAEVPRSGKGDPRLLNLRYPCRPNPVADVIVVVTIVSPRFRKGRQRK